MILSLSPLRQLIVKNTGFQLGAHGVSLIIGLATNFLLSRYLGVEAFGQFNYIFSFFYFFMALNDFGVTTVVVREISQRPDQAGRIIGSMLGFKLPLALVWMLTAWALITAANYPDPLHRALLLYGLILPVTALQLPGAIFQTLLKMQYPSLIGIINRISGFSFLILAMSLGWGLPGIIGGLILAEILSLIIMLVTSRKFVLPVFQLDWGLYKKVFASSMVLGFAGLFGTVVNRIDFIMIERMANLHELGLYSAAYRVTTLLEAFPLLLMGSFYPLMSKYALEDPARLKQLYWKSLLLLSSVGIPMGIAVTFLAPWIVQILFGKSFLQAADALKILVWATVFVYLAISGGIFLISIGKEKISLWVLMVSAGLNIALNFLWIPVYGIQGAAAATVAAFFLIFILTALAVSHYEKKMKPSPHG